VIQGLAALQVNKEEICVFSSPATTLVETGNTLNIEYQLSRRPLDNKKVKSILQFNE
jgi:hypothetical protein